MLETTFLDNLHRPQSPHEVPQPMHAIAVAEGAIMHLIALLAAMLMALFYRAIQALLHQTGKVIRGPKKCCERLGDHHDVEVCSLRDGGDHSVSESLKYVPTVMIHLSSLILRPIDDWPESNARNFLATLTPLTPQRLLN
jgi:hypothetical protein